MASPSRLDDGSPPLGQTPSPGPALGPVPEAWTGRVLLLTGPTAVGKSELALEAAERWGAEIVVADSMQVYRGLDIGTAKPTARERARVPHWLIDLVDFTEPFTLHDWLWRAREQAGDILRRGRRILVAGGTGFYLRAFLLGMADAATWQVAPELRRQIRETSPDALRAWLCRVDPGAGASVALDNPRRVARALEQVLASGRPLAALRPKPSGPPAWPRGVPVWVLDRPPAELRARIARRVRAMLDAGWVDEVAGLRRRGFAAQHTAGQALGYRDILAHLEGALPGDALAERIAHRTWQYARRQKTWFRHQLPGCWRDPRENRPLPAWEELFAPGAGQCT